MSVEGTLASLQQLKSNLKRFTEQALIEAGFDVLQDVQDRIQNKGLKADGSRLRSYSKYYERFKKNPGGTERGKKLGLGASRYTGVVDYTLTSRMWNSIHVFPVTTSGTEIRVRIGTTDNESVEKLKRLSERDSHNPLEPSEEELNRAFSRLPAMIADVIDRNR